MTKKIRSDLEHLLARNERLYRLLGFRVHNFNPGANGDFDATGTWTNISEPLCEALDTLAKEIHPAWGDDHTLRLAYDRRLAAEQKSHKLADTVLHKTFGKNNADWVVSNPVRNQAIVSVCGVQIRSQCHPTAAAAIRELVKIAKDVRSRHVPAWGRFTINTKTG